MSSLDGQNVLLGVTGGIAAYKGPDLVRRLRERGATVQVVMTRGACEFVTPLTFQAVSHRPVRTELWDREAEMAMGHIELARWADQILVAPASADFMARLAQGRADDLLSTLCLASEAPISLAPAMNSVMWDQAATQDNLALLRQRGVAILGPGTGELAEGESGMGRMLEPDEIAAAMDPATSGLLRGCRVVITAGPTHEALDPVRYLSNHSSGRMGFAVAEAAARAGAEVVLVSGPVTGITPPGVERVDVETAREMRDAVFAHLEGADVFIATAAVADYRPAEVGKHKLKKTELGEDAALQLVRNPDIVGEVAQQKPRPFIVGFAAETKELEAHARDKLQRKGLDLIAANQVGPGQAFGTADNRILLVGPDGNEDLGHQDKPTLARLLIERIAGSLKPKD